MFNLSPPPSLLESIGGLYISLFHFRLINTLKPGSIKKINRIQSGSFKQFKDMENIENFLKAIESYGVATADKFGTPNLTDRNNGMAIVLNCLHAVGRAVSVGPRKGFPWRRQENMYMKFNT